MVYLGGNKENAVTLTHSAQRKHDFLVKTRKIYKSKRIKLLCNYDTIDWDTDLPYH